MQKASFETMLTVVIWSYYLGRKEGRKEGLDLPPSEFVSLITCKNHIWDVPNALWNAQAPPGPCLLGKATASPLGWAWQHTQHNGGQAWGQPMTLREGLGWQIQQFEKKIMFSKLILVTTIRQCMIITRRLCDIMSSTKWHNNLPPQTLKVFSLWRRRCFEE
jgi:hypothetical protein